MQASNLFAFLDDCKKAKRNSEELLDFAFAADFLELGERRTARVVVRRNLETGELLAQTILGPGVTSRDPGVIEVTTGALDRLREQVGLD